MFVVCNSHLINILLLTQPTTINSTFTIKPTIRQLITHTSPKTIKSPTTSQPNYPDQPATSQPKHPHPISPNHQANVKDETIEIAQRLHQGLIGAKGKLIKSISDDCGGVQIRFPNENVKSDKVGGGVECGFERGCVGVCRMDGLEWFIVVCG